MDDKTVRGVIKNVIIKLRLGFLLQAWRCCLRGYWLFKYRWQNRGRFLTAWCEQNKFDKSELHADKIVVFVLYRKMMVNGGFISIFNIASTSREVLGDAGVVLCTGPGNPDIYARNTLFPNHEKVWRWSQVRNNSRCTVKKLTLHLPECFIGDFLNNLSRLDKRFLKSVPDLRINILNQNIWLMPERDDFIGLYDYTENVTQTTAHSKYNSQEMCDHYRIPTMRIGGGISYDAFLKLPFEKKEPIIAYSPDMHPMRESILEVLKAAFPMYKFVEIRDMTFLEYMDLITQVMIVITFGEGMDGYFVQPVMVKTVSFAVFNDDFFPSDQDWLALPTVFGSYDDMLENIVPRVEQVIGSSEVYNSYIDKTRSFIERVRMTKEEFQDNVRRFYEGKFDYYPTGARDHS